MLPRSGFRFVFLRVVRISISSRIHHSPLREPSSNIRFPGLGTEDEKAQRMNGSVKDLHHSTDVTKLEFPSRLVGSQGIGRDAFLAQFLESRFDCASPRSPRFSSSFAAAATIALPSTACASFARRHCQHCSFASSCIVARKREHLAPTAVAALRSLQTRQPPIADTFITTSSAPNPL